MMLQWATPKTWNRWSATLIIGVICQSVILMSFSLFFFPDLGHAGLENENFLGTVLGRNSWQLAQSTMTIGALLVFVSALISLNMSMFRLGLKVGLGLGFAALLNLWMIVERPQTAESWFLYQRSATFRGFQHALEASLRPWQKADGYGFTYFPLYLLLALASLNLVLEVLRFRRENQRLQRHKKLTLGSPVDLLDKRHSIAGISLFCSLVAALTLVGVMDIRMPWTNARSGSLRAPNVFVIGIDGLSEPQGFLRTFTNEADFKAPFLNGSTDPYAIWSEWMSCQLGLRTGRRNRLSRRNLQSLGQLESRSLAQTAQKEGYVTLLSADMTGVYLEDEAMNFNKKLSPHLGVFELTQSSLLRSAPTLQAFILLTDLRTSFPAVLLSAGALHPYDVAAGVIDLIDKESKPGSPVFTVALFGQWESFSNPNSLSNQLDPETIQSGKKNKDIQVDQKSMLVDQALRKIWTELGKRGFLRDSVFVILGLRPQLNLKETDAQKLTSSFLTSIAVKSNGLGQQYDLDDAGGRLFRSIDLAPTLAKRMMLKTFASEKCDGESFLDPVDKAPLFPRDQMYAEGSLNDSVSFLQKKGSSIGFLDLLESRTADLKEFSYAPGVEEYLTQFRSRAWFQANETLEFIPSSFGLKKTASNQNDANLVLNKNFDTFLESFGLTLEKSGEDHFYIQENSLP